MEIRCLQAGDFESFCRVMNNFYQYSGEEKAHEEQLRNLFEKIIDENINFILVGAFVDLELAGIASLTFAESSYKVAPFAWCDDMFVEENYRGQGIGKQIIIKLKEIAQKRGCSNIMLGVGEDELESQKFYESQGFFDMKCKWMSLPLEHKSKS